MTRLDFYTINYSKDIVDYVLNHPIGQRIANKLMAIYCDMDHVARRDFNQEYCDCLLYTSPSPRD